MRKSRKKTLDRVVILLEAVMGLELEDLEHLVQQAHTCSVEQIDDPVEPFPVTRQALRMLWHFRSNLEAVEVTPAHG